MLGRTLLQLSVCAFLCACGGNYPKKPNACAADGGCDCSGESCADAATSNDAGELTAQAGAASSRTRSDATRVATDAGAHDAAAPEAEEPSKPSSGSAAGAASDSGKKRSAQDQSGAGGAAGAAMKPAKKTEPSHSGAAGHDQGGSSATTDAPACEATCGPCQACDEQKRCQLVTGHDDADSCADTRTCSSRGACLQISEAQPDLGSRQDYAELTQSYAQVLTFVEPATIQEIRLEVSCNENDESFPAVWLAAAPGGIPSDTIIATANVLYQAPSDTNTFALLELSKTIEEPATGPIAIVVSKSDMSCIIRLNTENPYPNGNLFTQTGPLWAPAEGSMVFQVLSSQ